MTDDIIRRQCPSCPDGNEWGIDGPTGRACPVCGGKAYIVDDPNDDAEEER